MLGFTAKAVQNASNSAASTYDAAAAIAMEVAQRLDERLDFMRIKPQTILDLGTGTGYSSGFLSKRYPGTPIIAIDFAESMLKQAQRNCVMQSDITWICADASHLPLADHSVDLVVSSLMLPWCVEPEAVLAQVRRVLRPGGLFLFATLGPDTLQEIRFSWAKVDEKAHVHLFFDMHDLGDAVLRSGLIDPVMDMEVLTLSYANPRRLCRDLKQSGWQNLLEQRHPYLTGKNRWQQFLAQYETWRDDEGRLPLTYEVVYGHAFYIESTANKTGSEFSIPIDKIKRR